MAYQAGQKLGNYQLERFLGHGGFAEVYLGKHIYLHTYAAIKVLQRQSSDEALEKFLQEARIIAGLKHPHIVDVLDFGIEGQRPFLIMAYAPHGTLRQRYGRGKALSAATILPHVQQVASALQYAHERKIIHRDVKPENMLLDGSKAVQLSDFGLALRERSTYHSVHSTDSAGTIVYMSPEQLKGKPSTASDQYALGIVMYEWLCGCLPFDGPDVSIVLQHLHESPVPLREHISSVSPKIEAVVLKALAKDPKQRFATIRDLSAAFTEACKGIPVPENAVLSLDTVQQGDAVVSVEQAESWVDVASVEAIKILPDLDRGEISPGVMPGTAWPSHYSSLRAPSLSASLNMASQDVKAQMVELYNAANASTVPAHKEARVSRRTVIAGIAGIAVMLGGVGIWRASFSGIEALPQNAQVMQKSSDAATSVVPSQRRTPASTGNSSTPGTGGTTPASGSGTGVGKGGTASPVATGTSGSTGAATPPSTPSSSGNPSATSTPGSSSGATPVATSIAPVALTVQINVPFSIVRGANVPILVMTNSGNVSFTVTAEFYYIDQNGQAQNDRHANISGNTTDSNGNALLRWQCWQVPYGQFKKMTDPHAVFQAIATDGSGKSVSSQTVTAQMV